MLDGTMTFALVSPVFKQNLYNGVYDDLEPDVIPHEIDFFNLHASYDKYPFLRDMSDYVLTTQAEKGDCLYIPALFWK